MSEPEPEPWPLVDFLLQLRQDQAAGVVRSLRDYLACYPDHEDAVAREYLLVRALDAAPGVGEHVRIGPFDLIEQLGRGGEGTVHLAHDRTLGRRVALKLLDATASDLDAARVLRGASIAARLDHPALVRVLGAGREGARLWVASAYVEGRSLQVELDQRRATGRTFAARELAAMLAPVARGLQHAHEEGVLHRDVKPGNLLLRHDGTLLLGDFGLAREENPANPLTVAGELRGTVAYMAPEQMQPGPVGPGVDVHALGIVAIECATMQQPFGAATLAATMAQVERRQPWSLPGWSRLHPDLRAVLAMATAKDPRQRYASAAAFAADLERLAAGQPVLARQPGRLRRFLAWARCRPLAAGSLAVAGLAVCATLVVTVAFLCRERELRLAAEAHAARVRSVAKAVLFDPGYTGRDDSHTVAGRIRIVQQALRAMQQLAADAPDDRQLQRELCIAWFRLAQLLGNDAGANPAEPGRAGECLDQAAKIALERLPGDPRQSALLAAIDVQRGDLCAATSAARDHYLAALARVGPDNRECRMTRGTAMSMLAQQAREAGDLPAARDWIVRARAEFGQDLDDEDSRDGDLAAAVAEATIVADEGDPARALDLLAWIEPRLGASVASMRLRIHYERVLAGCLVLLDRPGEVLQHLDAAIAGCRSLFLRDGTDRGAVRRLGELLLQRAEVQSAFGNLDAATADRIEADKLAAEHELVVRQDGRLVPATRAR
jgi:hypothetical protein